ncbi:uncharacterized protein DSM5745_10457 [Aspergillus mulundensis]|uniref:Uncharacterized protein n=1 Tax=Aspergillus mulundensis TaxID=1810919 RepID=A0A3D8QJ01_9EURO|nr:hypothetical protein DSM5745_10457 [Aspergillus mulundensis]RDW61785.1 hypothetical protein DSM5745_10457 [Aspergillus mulundensis]
MDAPSAPSRTELGKARDAIAAFLIEKDIPAQIADGDTQAKRDIDVELVFPDMCFRPSTLSIPSTHPAAAAYETVRKEIMELIDQTLQDKWCGLSLHLLGLVKERSDPTVVVYLLPYTVADWGGLAALIQGLLPPGESINVEFLPGSFAFTLDGR